jgi:polyphosphate kinase
VPYLHDGRDAWDLGANGRYTRTQTDGHSAQAALMHRYSQRHRR